MGDCRPAAHVEGVLPLSRWGMPQANSTTSSPGSAPLGVGEDLAVLAADELGQLIPVLLHQLLEAKQHPGPHQRRGLGPLPKGALGAGNRLGTLIGRAENDGALLLAGGRIEDGTETLAATLGRLAVDEVARSCNS